MSTHNNLSPGFATNRGKSITVEPHHGVVAVSAAGVEIARTNAAKILTEAPYAPVFYIPFADIDFTKLGATDHSTHCPYKGNASYWSVVPAGAKGVNAMWAYKTPFDEMEAIKDHGAFYPDRVTIKA